MIVVCSTNQLLDETFKFLKGMSGINVSICETPLGILNESSKHPLETLVVCTSSACFEVFQNSKTEFESHFRVGASCRAPEINSRFMCTITDWVCLNNFLVSNRLVIQIPQRSKLRVIMRNHWKYRVSLVIWIHWSNWIYREWRRVIGGHPSHIV